MRPLQPLLALDIGSTKIACAVGVPHQQTPGFELLGSSLVNYPVRSSVWLNDPLMVSRAIEQAVEAARGTADCYRALVAMNHPQLSGEEVQVAIPLGDEPVQVRSQDLHRLQASALHQVLGIDREPLLVQRLGCTGNGFDRVRDPRGLLATRLSGTFHVVSMPMAARRAITQMVESAGVEITRLSYSLPGALAGVGDSELAQQRVVVIDIGGVSADIGLVVEQMLQRLRVLPWGGMTLAEAMAAQLRVPVDQAMSWSLQGTGCRKPDVRAIVQQHWDQLIEAIATVTQGEPLPDRVIVAGRGGLMDGLAEWIESTTKIPTSVGLSNRVNRLGDVPQQVGLATAIGLLEMATQQATPRLRPDHLFNRLLHRTRTILTEYF